MTAPAADVAVIGGGVIGAATADVLARAGARVSLYEQTEIAAAASGRNSGVVQHPFDAVLVELYRETREVYRALANEPDSGFWMESEPSGLLLTGHDERLATRLADAFAATHPATRPRLVGGDELVRLEPAIAPDVVACRLEIGYPVIPAAATRALAGRAARHGAALRIGDEVRPAIRAGVAHGVEVEGRFEAAGAVVVAAGPWTPELLDPTGRWRPIRRVWGVVAHIDLPAAPRHVIEEASIDIEPAGDVALGAGPDGAPGRAALDDHHGDGIEFSLVTAAGESSLGSTFLEREPDPAAMLAAIRARGARFVPRVAEAPLLGLRSCARPVSADGRPIVGPVPGIERAFIAAGHGPWGISTGPATARMVADLVLGRPAQVPAALDPARFGPPG